MRRFAGHSIRVVLLAAACFLSAHAQAQGWRPVAETEVEAYLIDPGNVVEIDGKKLASVLVTGHEGLPLPNYGSRLQLVVFDCAGNALALKEYSLFARPGAQGQRLASGAYPDAELSFTHPSDGSVGDKLLKFVCQP